MNGVVAVIHGARAGEAQNSGEPVVQTVRDLLRAATTTTQALEMLTGRDPMVPHMLLIADASGDAAIVERVPGAAPFVRKRDGASLPLTNHFEGPHADDPKNVTVKNDSSTLPRRGRLDELLAATGKPDVDGVIAMLRDKLGTGSVALPLGHRNAIDALIATHSVVFDTTARVIYVSEGRHATGRFIRFDLRELLAPDYVPSGAPTVDALPADSIVSDGRYKAWVDAGGAHHGAN